MPEDDAQWPKAGHFRVYPDVRLKQTFDGKGSSRHLGGSAKAGAAGAGLSQYQQLPGHGKSK